MARLSQGLKEGPANLRRRAKPLERAHDLDLQRGGLQLVQLMKDSTAQHSSSQTSSCGHGSKARKKKPNKQSDASQFQWEPRETGGGRLRVCNTSGSLSEVSERLCRESLWPLRYLLMPRGQQTAVTQGGQTASTRFEGLVSPSG